MQLHYIVVVRHDKKSFIWKYKNLLKFLVTLWWPFKTSSSLMWHLVTQPQTPLALDCSEWPMRAISQCYTYWGCNLRPVSVWGCQNKQFTQPVQSLFFIYFNQSYFKYPNVTFLSNMTAHVDSWLEIGCARDVAQRKLDNYLFIY
jgi:hypothetical protein